MLYWLNAALKLMSVGILVSVIRTGTLKVMGLRRIQSTFETDSLLISQFTWTANHESLRIKFVLRSVIYTKITVSGGYHSKQGYSRVKDSYQMDRFRTLTIS